MLVGSRSTISVLENHMYKEVANASSYLNELADAELPCADLRHHGRRRSTTLPPNYTRNRCRLSGQDLPLGKPRSGHTVVFVAYDECDQGDNHVYTVVVSPPTPTTNSVAGFNHYSLLRTVAQRRRALGVR